MALENLQPAAGSTKIQRIGRVRIWKLVNCWVKVNKGQKKARSGYKMKRGLRVVNNHFTKKTS